MKRELIKDVIKEEIEKIMEEMPIDNTIYSNPEHISADFKKFELAFKTHMAPILMELEALKKSIDTNASKLSPEVVSKFRQLIIKLGEVKKLKDEISIKLG